MSDRLEDVKPGGLVVYDYPNAPDRLVEVAKVTKCSIILKGSDSRFNIKTGSIRGDHGPWSYASIRVATAEDIKRINGEVRERNAGRYVCEYVDTLRRCGDGKKFLKLAKFIKENL